MRWGASKDAEGAIEPVTHRSRLDKGGPSVLVVRVDSKGTRTDPICFAKGGLPTVVLQAPLPNIVGPNRVKCLVPQHVENGCCGLGPRCLLLDSDGRKLQNMSE